QPYSENAIHMRRSVDAYNELTYQKISAYIQDNIVLDDSNRMTLNLGSRITYTSFNDEIVVSPRAQFSYAPGKTNRNIIFRLATGMYAQPAFYREMRDMDGVLHLDVRS